VFLTTGENYILIYPRNEHNINTFPGYLMSKDGNVRS